MSIFDQKHAELLFNGVDLGPPLGPDIRHDNGGSHRRYDRGSIYYNPRGGGIHVCYGKILQRYEELGEWRSGLGYPFRDQMHEFVDEICEYEAGAIRYNAADGIRVEYVSVDPVPEFAVKVRDHITVGFPQHTTAAVDTLGFVLGLPDGHPWIAQLRLAAPGLYVRRMFDGLSNDELAELVTRARQHTPGYQPPNFENYLIVTCEAGTDISAVGRALDHFEGVFEFAYPLGRLQETAVLPNDDQWSHLQTYLRAAPAGLGVEAAWALGADGSHTQCIDIERGWQFQHEDLPKPIPFYAGINRAASFGHGCAVLGVVAGSDNSRGIVGIAPRAKVGAMSYWEPGIRSLEACITAAAYRLFKGDVILIEAQLLDWTSNHLVPPEIERAVFDAVELAANAGIVIVEPAGNQGINLDTYSYLGDRLFDPVSPAFRESGAIMVGGCTPGLPHQQDRTLNVGKRIDVWAWGDRVVTSGSRTDPMSTTEYMTSGHAFGGTSSAAAIICGVCLLIQDLKRSLATVGVPSGGVLDGQQMRTLLRKTGNGTAVSGSNRILPDFEKIIANEFPS